MASAIWSPDVIGAMVTNEKKLQYVSTNALHFVVKSSVTNMQLAGKVQFIHK